MKDPGPGAPQRQGRRTPEPHAGQNRAGQNHAVQNGASLPAGFRSDRVRTVPKLDAARLRALALAYAARYATSRGRLTAYLRRKVARSDWDEQGGEAEQVIATLVAEFAEKSYVDDQAYAAGRVASMRRRGYGARRIGAALHHAGIDPGQQAAILSEASDQEAMDAAHRYARRRRLGPYAVGAADGPDGPNGADAGAERRAIAAMVRAGHDFDVILSVLRTPDDRDADAEDAGE